MVTKPQIEGVTPERIAECLASKDWRMRNLYLILPEDDEEGGMIPFVLRAEQDQYLRERHSRNMTPKARKLGMSTLIVLDYLDECITTPKTHCAHVDFKEDDAFKKLDIARLAWVNGPMHPNPVVAACWRLIHEANPLASDAAGCLKWANGSKQEAGTSFMGGTPRRLHWSEAGPMSAQAPDRAAKVKRGSLNAIGANGIIDIETTMEGGEGTVARNIFDLALKMVGKPLTRMDWRLHFFPWFGHPSYDLPGHEPQQAETLKYIREMQERHAITLPASRWAWYEKKREEQKEDIWTQFPTIAEECTRAIVVGQLFPGMTTLRSKGRIRELDIEAKYPIHTFWDIGNDGVCAWLGQFPGRDALWHRFHFSTGKGATHCAEVVRSWEQELGRTIAKHFFPHDVDYRDKGYSKTYRAQLVEAGIPNHKIITVPIAGDKWDGINAVRDRVSRFFFDLSCEKIGFDDMGEELPSGIACLVNYRTQPKAASGAIRPMPLHDIHSHGADAMITFGAADEQSFITSNIEVEPDEDAPKKQRRKATFAFSGWKR